MWSVPSTSLIVHVIILWKLYHINYVAENEDSYRRVMHVHLKCYLEQSTTAIVLVS